MDPTEEKLLAETNKWLTRLEAKATGMGILKKSKELDNSVENIKAYIGDCHHFLSQKDYINAFEAVIYAWGILETLERLKLIECKTRA